MKGWRRIVWLSLLVALGAVVIALRLPIAAGFSSALHLSERSTVRQINRWAVERGIPPDAIILFDDLAYFDPKRFPKAQMHGGVMTWPAVEKVDPDYIVLSSSLFDADWMRNLIATKNLQGNASPGIDVRLYQDLLSADKPGPTKIPGIDLVDIIKAQESKSWLSQLATHCNLQSWCNNLFYDLAPTMVGLAQVELALTSRNSESGRLQTGPELRIYRIDKKGRPAAFASETADRYKPANAFDGTQTAWACRFFGEAARQCHIGYDFGEGGERRVRSVRIQWVYGASTPRAVRVEYSDDKSSWVTAAVVPVNPYPGSTANFRVDMFALPDSGKHRYWRVVVDDVAAGTGFAVAELTFLDAVAEAPR
jgi:hypothetical protein